MLKGHPSERRKITGFNVLTIIELNLLVGFTIPVNDGLNTFNLKKTMNHKLWAKSYELKAESYELRYKLKAMNYKLWATSFKIQVTSYKQKSVTCQILHVPADDSTVQDLDRSTIIWWKIKLDIDIIQLSWPICSGWWLYSRGHQPVGARLLRLFYGGRHLKDFVNSASKFNSIVVKTLIPVLCSSHDGVPLKFKKQTKQHYSSSMQILWAWFRPLLDLTGQNL